MSSSSRRLILPNERCEPQAPSDLLLARARFLRQIRLFFDDRSFLEVETPLLIPYADPSLHLASFQTTFHPPFQEPKRLFLHTSPEFAMKRLVAAGYPRIFQICKFFRDNERSPLHNPEFTGLEWYLVGSDYTALMEITEGMILALHPAPSLVYQGRELDLTPPWKRLTVLEALRTSTSYPFAYPMSYEQLAEACRIFGLSVTPDDAWDDLFFKIFLTYVEPSLGQKAPVFLTEYPAPLAALARLHPQRPDVCERTELYIGGLEIANGYTELTDPSEQRRRWEADAALRLERGDGEFPIDPSFLLALEHGLPLTTGIAVGLDRLFMLLLDAPTLQDVLPFPVESYRFPCPPSSRF